MHFQSQKIKIKFNFSWDARGVTGSWLVRNIFVDRVKSIGLGGQIIEYPLEVRYKYKGNRSTDPNIPPKVQVYLRYSGSNFLGRFNVNGVYHSNELDYGLSFPSTIFTSDGNTTDTSVDTQMAHDMEYGTVGIGTASPTRNLHVFHPTYGIHRSIYWSEKPGNPATENPIQMGYLGSSDPSHASGAIGLFQNTYEGGTEQEKVRIQANGNSWFDGGNVGIGKTDPAARLHIYPGSDGAFMIGSLGATEATAPMVMRDAGNEQIHFYYGTTKVGSITSTSTNTAFNTSSDYRLKENIVKLTSALDRVNEISVYQFNFISEPTRKVNGFIAHELQSIIPEAVTGVKDEMIEFGVVTRTNDGIVIQKDVKKPEILDEGMEWSVTSSKPNYQGVDQSKLVPLLTRSVQELSIKNDTLETQLNSVLARLDALENA
jgi:hypothetical protein